MSSITDGKNVIPPPPSKPDPLECCGSGCVPCIFDYYYDALEKWQQTYGDAQEQDKNN